MAFLWIVPEEWLPLMNANGGVSPCYSVPINMLSSWKDLVGSPLYIIARNKTVDYLFARVEIDSIEVGVDENDKANSYLLNVNLVKSLRMTRLGKPEDAHDFTTESVRSIPQGFTQLKDVEKRSFDELITSQFKNLFTRPSKILERIDPPVQRCGAAFAPVVLLQEVVMKYALSEMWGNIKNFNHPAANFAYEYVVAHPDFLSSGSISDFREVLKDYDWVPGNRHKQTDSYEPRSKHVLQKIDIVLTPIVPSDIKVRHFASNDQTISLEAVMRKTESAEREHQEMLRDISKHLIEIGIAPYQSDSIDLAVKQESQVWIFELKTISAENLVSQVSKGLFQLIYYAKVLNDCGVSTGHRYLVVKTKHYALSVLQMMNDILNSAGVVLLLYDPDEEWPNRVTVFNDELDRLESFPFSF